MADDDKPRLDYEQRESLEEQGKKFSGIRQSSWVDDKSICTTCKYSHIVRRTGKNIQSVYCTDVSQWVPGDIAECSSHKGFTELSINQMSGIATLIGGFPERNVGFKKE